MTLNTLRTTITCVNDNYVIKVVEFVFNWRVYQAIKIYERNDGELLTLTGSTDGG